MWILTLLLQPAAMAVVTMLLLVLVILGIMMIPTLSATNRGWMYDTGAFA